MKNFLLILASLILAFAFEASGQPLNKSVANDTIKANDVTFDLGYTVTQYEGIAGFQFTVDTVKGKADNVILQGTYISGSYVNLDSLTTVGNGTYFMSDAPPAYSTYRLLGDGSAGDTIIFKNIRAIYKRE